mmetsp:Transcript_11754/g.21126  ORF Transcript_11754/g.21126 Transcript_11754/m.21126 type:complete len:471 (-) Transcript_11754:106-1518(-)
MMIFANPNTKLKLNGKLTRSSLVPRQISVFSHISSSKSTNDINTTPIVKKKELGEAIRHEFPILHQIVHDKPLVYFDNAATSQKPQPVLNTLSDYYTRYNSNVHRGVHTLSSIATSEYELARVKVANFINAYEPREVVFTKNATEAINLVAYSWARQNIKPGDEIILSVAEHHSNLVPWHLLASQNGAILRFVRMTPHSDPSSKRDGQQLDLKHFNSLLSRRTKLVSLVHVSNVLGAALDISHVAEATRRFGAKLLLDCCQSIPHVGIDVRALGADWVVGSSHKFCGPTGAGFLWGRYSVLESMAPFLGGGEMIQDVFLDYSTYAAPPARFEAGTPAIGEVIGMGAAAAYLQDIGMTRVHAYEQEIGGYLYDKLAGVPGVEIYGPSHSHAKRGRAALCAFNIKDIHATDLATLLDAEGIAVRSGHHCTQPLHRELGVSASARASLYIYNSHAEVDAFIDALKDVIKFLKE